MSHHPFSDIPSETVASLGEHRLIGRLRDWLGAVVPPCPAGMGDDCAAAPFQPAGAMLVTVDSVVYGRHFDASVSPRRAGRKLANRNLSDIAAMGGIPDRAVVALMLPHRTRTDWLREFYLGLAEAAAAAGLAIVGGDISETTADLSASLTLIGSAARPLSRKGGRAGDLLAVTGALGGSILGRHADFTPRLAEGRWLAGRGEVLSLMDVTDGLAKDLPELLPENTAAVLDLAKLPLHADAHTLAARDGRPAEHHALADGEDYELVMALAAGTDPEAFLTAWRGEFPEVPLTLMGRIENAPAGTAGRLVNRADGLPVGAAGYAHLG